jgi:lysozyme
VAIKLWPEPPAGTLRGIDVSQFQGVVDWAGVLPQISFSFIRATDGGQTDTQFGANARALSTQKAVLWGAYHVLETTRTAQAQADYFCGAALNEGCTLPPVLDFELAAKGEPSSVCVRRALDWLDAVQTIWKIVPIVYCGPSFIDTLAQQTDVCALAEYPLWVAHYRAESLGPTLPQPWQAWDFWQSSGGTFALPNGTPVDLDLFHGSAQDLAQFGGG